MKESELTDNEIVTKILEGEKSLFAIFIKKNNQKLFRIIRSYINDEDEVRDVMQDTYMKAYEKLSQFRGDSAFSTWLVRIGINESYLRLRKLNRISDFGDDELLDDVLENSPEQVNLRDPESIIEQKEANVLIEKAIDDLPAKVRVVYVMREIEGLSVKETAEHLDISEANVKVRLHRAKDLLKIELSQYSTNQIFEFGNHHCDILTEEVISRILEAAV